MGKKHNTVSPPPPAEPADRAILVELENVAFPGRQITFDVMRSVLSEKDVALTPLLYTRYCLYPPVTRGLTPLLKAAGRQRLSESKLAAEISEGIRHCLLNAAGKPGDGIAALLREAPQRHVAVGALSSLNRADAVALAGKLGLSEPDARVESCRTGEAVDPDGDAWLALCKRLHIPPTQCLAAVSSAAAARGALAAGMSCAVIPDTFTEFQDFAGADLLVDAFTPETAGTLLDFLDERL
ncbi:MAG: hypothetical protein JW951_10400 [Lentisphaerae bacterium]|nr:hypothetical protein [Lentisphaerota bacterium]